MLDRLLSVRIVRWPLKLVYVVAAWLVGGLLIRLLGMIGLPDFILVPLDFAVSIASVLMGARIFRGKSEAVEPARAWWRMTAWRPLSQALGILFAVAAAFSALNTVLLIFGIHLSRISTAPWEGWAYITLLYSSLTFLYLNSAIRLKRAGIVRPEPEPKLTRAPKLD